MQFKDLLSGFIRLHILHHAAEHEVYGQWMIDELARHGYKLSPGTLYPMLHTMEKWGPPTTPGSHGEKALSDYRVGQKSPDAREDALA